jgi:hypothetical protein
MKSIALLTSLMAAPLFGSVGLDFNVQVPGKADIAKQVVLSEEMPSYFNFAVDELYVDGAITSCDQECVDIEIHVHSLDERGAITGVSFITLQIAWSEKAEVIVNEKDINESSDREIILSVIPTLLK